MKTLFECAFMQRVQSKAFDTTTEQELLAEYQIFQSCMQNLLYSDYGYSKIDFHFNDLLIILESQNISKKKRPAL